MKKISLFILAIALISSAYAGGVKAPHCKTIIETCKKAGFIAGDWKNGDGLWAHCVEPILGRPVGQKRPPMKAGLTVPTVAAADVQACLSENPNIGMAKKK